MYIRALQSPFLMVQIVRNVQEKLYKKYFFLVISVSLIFHGVVQMSKFGLLHQLIPILPYKYMVAVKGKKLFYLDIYVI